MSGKNRKNLDPLFQLFEHFLMTRSYDDSAAFTKQLADQYLAYLDSTPAHVPFQNRANVLEDLVAEAHEMLVKKMYGVVVASDYENRGAVMQVEPDAEVKPLQFTPSLPMPEPTPEK